MTVSVLESEMNFGPFPKDCLFHVEKSVCYGKLGKGVKTAEFLLLRDRKGLKEVWVVEAKKSSPSPTSAIQFNEFVDEIREKFLCSLLFGASCILRRHEGIDVELPMGFHGLDLSKLGFRFILVIKGHDAAWLAPLQSRIAISLRSLVKSWNLDPNCVVVLNDTLAISWGIVSSTI